MTLYVTLVGKYYDNFEDLHPRNELILCKIEDDDPNILAINSDFEVCFSPFGQTNWKRTTKTSEQK